MKKCMDAENINNRLKRIEGQVRGIMKMVDEDKNCENILIQIAAIKSALHKTGQIILEGHLQHCVIDGIKQGDETETMKRLASAIEQFSRL